MVRRPPAEAVLVGAKFPWQDNRTASGMSFRGVSLLLPIGRTRRPTSSQSVKVKDSIIAAAGQRVYWPSALSQDVPKTSGAPNPDLSQSIVIRSARRFIRVLKWTLRKLGMIWRRLVSFIGTIRSDLMVELERNPQAVRQGAAAAVCIAAAGLAMPVIADRAAEQRDGAQWTAQRVSYAQAAEVRAAGEGETRVQLVGMRSADGFRARGSAFVVNNGFDRQALLVHAALRGPLPAPAAPAPLVAGPDALNPSELRCLSEAIYYEARGESYRGQVAVAEVVMNRVGSRHYPGSVCGVVYQGSHRATGCQFTFTCDGSLNRRPRGRAWERARNIASQMLLGYTRPVTGSATHYHTTAVSPVWSATLVETARVGEHVFYRFPSRNERAALMAALERRRGAGRVTAQEADEALAATLPPEPEDVAVVQTVAASDPRGTPAPQARTADAPRATPAPVRAASAAPPAASAPVQPAREMPSREMDEVIAVPPPADDDELAADEVET